MNIVDTHAHIYSENEVHYPMIPSPLRPPPDTGTIDYLKQETKTAGVTRVVAIQTSTAYKWDNRFLADAVKANSDWMAGVCTLNPEDPSSPDELIRLVENYGIRGMRSVAASGNPPLSNHPGVIKLWETAAKVGITVNPLISVSLADELEQLLERFPQLPVVLDHCMNLQAGEDGLPTFKKLSNLAKHSNLYAKLSFIPTGSKENFPCRDMHGMTKQVIEMFGPDRCVWGSDYPCELWCPKVTYSQNLKIFTEELGLNDSEKRAILETTPMRLWFSV